MGGKGDGTVVRLDEAGRGVGSSVDRPARAWAGGRDRERGGGRKKGGGGGERRRGGCVRCLWAPVTANLPPLAMARAGTRRTWPCTRHSRTQPHATRCARDVQATCVRACVRCSGRDSTSYIPTHGKGTPRPFKPPPHARSQPLHPPAEIGISRCTWPRRQPPSHPQRRVHSPSLRIRQRPSVQVGPRPRSGCARKRDVLRSASGTAVHTRVADTRARVNRPLQIRSSRGWHARAAWGWGGSGADGYTGRMVTARGGGDRERRVSVKESNTEIQIGITSDCTGGCHRTGPPRCGGRRDPSGAGRNRTPRTNLVFTAISI